MPDSRTNHLVVTFTVSGTYIVRCLDYCGMGHHQGAGGAASDPG